MDPATRFRSTLPLVEAKFRPPIRRQATIDRPRLISLLMAAGGPRVVAITAPPGYGKTTLLAQWQAHEPRPVAWLTVDDLDNDPAVLLSYLATAFDRILPVDDSVRSALSAPHERILTTAVPRLLTALDGWHRPAALVVDDVHRLVDRTSLDVLAALLDHLPPSFRVVHRRSQRAGPRPRAAPGGRRPARDWHGAARADRHRDRGDRRGAGSSAEPGRGPGADRPDRGLGRGRTSRRARLAAGGGWCRSCWADVSGRDRYIAAYFRSEFQRDLADADLAVLTRTSILETVTASSAVAVSGIPDAGERIEAVARASLLIQELGGSTATYRYHNLLHDFLRGELERREPDARPDLHRRAAAWHLATRNLDRAVSHAIASGDREMAARTVTAAALPTFYGGHTATVDRWIGSFDVADFERNPPLAVIAGWMHLLNGRGDAADRMAGIADRSPFDGPPGDGSASFESQRAMLRAVMGRRGTGRRPGQRPAGHIAGASRQPVAGRMPCGCSGRHGCCVGDVEAADAALAEAIEAGSTAAVPLTVALAKRAGIAIMRGDWAAAEDLAQQEPGTARGVPLRGDPAIAPRLSLPGRAPPSTGAISPVRGRTW